MDHLKSPFRFWSNQERRSGFLQKVGNQKCRADKFQEQAIRMSDINHSFDDLNRSNLKTTDLDEDFDESMSIKTNIYSSTVSKLENQNGCKYMNDLKEQEINIELKEEHDELDFRRFIKDLTKTQINFINETQEVIVTKDDVITERIPYHDLINNTPKIETKQMVVFENSPNNNSKEVKIIKVKITVPKGALNNSLSNKNVLNIVNDLSATENVFETPENTPEKQNKFVYPDLSITPKRSVYRSPTKTNNISAKNSLSDLYSSPNKLYKSPSKANKAHKSPTKSYKTPLKMFPFKASNSPRYKTNSIEKMYEVADLDNLVNRSPNYKPIMGKTALLAKANAVKNLNPIETTRDSAIVQELVTERFNEFLVSYYQRSFRRQSSRKDRTMDEDVVEEIKKEDSIFDTNLIKHSSTLNESNLNEPIYETINNYTKTEDNIKNYYSNDPIPIYESITNLHFETQNAQEDVKSYTSTGHNRGILQSLPSTSSVDEHYSLHSFEVCSIGSFKDEINLNFILSTDDCNIETSFEVNNFSSKTEINEEGYETSSMHDDKVEYDAQKFLKAALGDEYISTDSQWEDSIHGTDFSKNQSIGTSNISALISKASSLYSTISNKMQRNKLPNMPIYEEAPKLQNEYAECFSPNKKLSELIQESVIQNQIMNQTSKALSLCKTIKEFVASVEQLEAERILLIATNKREAILEEIRKTEYEDINEFQPINLGIVKITNLKFPAKQIATQLENTPKRTRYFTQWFMCTANCGAKLFATKTVLPDENGMISFDEEFIFSNLCADFEVNVCVYSMKVRNNMRNYSHESKYKLNKNGKKMCPTPPHKLFSLHKQSPSKSKSPADEFRPSSFELWGKITLRINHLKNIDQFKLLNVPPSSTLDGTVLMDLQGEVELREKYSGFLNIGTESGEGVTWNRRWCSLNESILNYYNYPCEEDATTPLGYIDLRCCVSSWVSTADREICARPRTLLLETATPPHLKRRNSTHSHCSNIILRHFLTSDTNHEMKMWETRLNSVISALRNWKSMKVSLQFNK